MSTTHRTTWDTYASTWKEPDAARKLAALERCCSPDCVYRDPLTQTRGWNELVAYMLQFHEQVPGGHFVVQSFAAHHDRSLATWHMCAANGDVLGTGTSYGEYDAAGKLLTMTGFFETSP